jgi:hypothetical protein
MNPGGKLKDDQPAISWDEGAWALQQFRLSHVPHLGPPESIIHRVHFMTSGGGGGRTFIELLYDGSKKDLPRLPEFFSYTPPGSEIKRELPIEIQQADHLRPHIRIGHKARAVGTQAQAFGTAGWNVRLNGNVCCMSARHVIAYPFISPANTRVLLDERDIATRGRVEPVALPQAMNLFDVGVARYVNESDAEKFFVQCQDGDRPYGYPMGFCMTAATGQSFHKVGAGSLCTESILRQYLNAYGDIAVWYGTQKILYTAQLCFDPFATNGDSGAVVARDGDWTAVGVHHTGDTKYSYSSPIFKLPWTQVAHYQIPGTPRIIPSFTV